jgi:hypothetical protein
MTTKQWNDEKVMAELALALKEPDVPPSILEAAKAVYTWRTVDAELAQLSYDSAAAGNTLVGVRGVAAPLRSLSFEAPGLLIEVDVTGDSLVGQVVPPEPGTLEVHEASGLSTRVSVDETGCFNVRPLPTRAFRLAYHTAAGCQAVTVSVAL